MHERVKADGTVVAAGSENLAAAAKLKGAAKKRAAEPKAEPKDEPKDEPKSEPAKAEGTPLSKSEPPKPATSK